MKKLFILLVLLIISHCSFAQLKFIRCISGDCRNGRGQAIFINPTWTTPGEYTYTGTFKEGQMDGEGSLISNVGNFNGSFKNGKQLGYGIDFFSKKVNGINVPDSEKWVNIGRWDEDDSYHCIQIHEDGTTGYYNTAGNGEHSKHFHPYAEVKDKWIKTHVADYLAAMEPVFAERRRVHDSMYPPQVIVDHHMLIRSQGRVNTARGRLENLCSWDCTSGLKYYVTASNVVRGKLSIMPIGGFVRYQVRGEDDQEIWEGAADQYWHPEKDGRYKFLIIFDVGTVYGAQPADGAQIQWSLRSETL